ncbi:MAG: hypothetical protein H0W40_15315 [Methylibium sp.]|uniref:hypothetical protein n=1 Tax=Methylibium sp. TaxID=2067992 RepID=UPI0017C81C1E|nr:hypothetical protein [Methylibium sp.]MBA3598727.1 hypothetical protein [Methylibium sp.]
MLLLVTSIKLIAEIALLALAGRWLLGLLAGAKREQNLFYQLLSIMTRPFTSVFRKVTPKVVIDRHIPLLTFVALTWVWVFALLQKVELCRGNIGQGLCQ